MDHVDTQDGIFNVFFSEMHMNGRKCGMYCTRLYVPGDRREY
jgi:hypothetical protein